MGINGYQRNAAVSARAVIENIDAGRIDAAALDAELDEWHAAAGSGQPAADAHL